MVDLLEVPFFDDAGRDDWFVTFTGKRFFILDPQQSAICIEDIAHALSMICRFGGHARRFYSVAQHSVHVSRLVPPEFALQGLMHDAAEAYVGDVIRPLKRQLMDYKRIEHSVELAIAYKFNLPTALHASVKAADGVALVTERRLLVPPHTWAWIEDEQKVVADEADIEPCSPHLAELEFLERYAELVGGR